MDKENALEYLLETAASIDLWTAGNLAFMQEGVGKDLLEFKRNFRGRLIPASRRADKRIIAALITPLTGFVNSFLIGALNQANIQGLNEWLTQRNPARNFEENFPYHPPPSKSRLSKDILYSSTPGRLLTISAVCLAAALATYFVGLGLTLSQTEAFGTAAVIFAGLFAGLATLMRPSAESRATEQKTGLPPGSN